jgi:hypothetical protein
VLELVARVPWVVVLVACATLGLAPFSPEPHVVEKLRMLAAGDLRDPVDWFDLVLHASPWILLVLRGIAAARGIDAPEA